MEFVASHSGREFKNTYSRGNFDKKQKENPLIMFAIFSALEGVSTEEGEGGAGLVVSAGDALHLQLKVQLQRFYSSQVS